MHLFLGNIKIYKCLTLYPKWTSQQDFRAQSKNSGLQFPMVNNVPLREIMADISLLSADFLNIQSHRSLAQTVLHRSVSLDCVNLRHSAKIKTDWCTKERFNNEVIKTFQVKLPFQPSSLINILFIIKYLSVIKAKPKVQCYLIFLSLFFWMFIFCLMMSKFQNIFSVSHSL